MLEMMRQRRTKRDTASRTLIRQVIVTSDGPDLEFDGECLLKETHDCIGEVAIYRTRAGALVASQSIVDPRSGGLRTRATTLRSVAELAVWLGHSAGVKQILARLGHPSRCWID